MGGVSEAIAGAARAAGAEIRSAAGAARIVVGPTGRAIGVELEDGSVIRAAQVVSSAHPQTTYLDLVGREHLPSDVIHDVERIRTRSGSVKVNVASSGLPAFPAWDQEGTVHAGLTAISPSMEYLERAFDDAKYGWYSQRPYIDGAIQSVVDPDMAPPGKHVMSCFIQYAPYDLKGSDWETERQPFADTVQAVLESHFPGFGDLVLHREVVTPVDIEQVAGLSEGNIFHGEFLAPQMYFMRPAPGYARYNTPIDGYYQCGSGTHPGGCVTGGPAKLAAMRILGDRAKKG
jgi:phytoene dehydrogenase-like protein